MSRPVALIGAGAMGGAIDARLVNTGTAQTVFDFDPLKVSALTEVGATPAPLAAEAAAKASAAAAEEAAAKGLRWVDSPLSGEFQKPRELTLMQGGACEDVAEAQDILAKVASNQTRIGGPGAGQTTKLINQILCGLGFLAVAEATALAEAAGVDEVMIRQALKGGRAATEAVLGRHFTGRINHHVTTAHSYAPA